MRPPRPDELTDGAVHDYEVFYPSGARLQLRGVFGTILLDGELSPTIRVGEALTVLDPRAVVARDGLLIHDPRRVATLPGWARSWLDEHPEWPRVATESLAC
jgi:hypothetical protein